MERDKLRALLLGGGGEDMPEGWGGGAFDGEDKGDVDMEVTFMPALSGTKEGDETTLEKYQRKMKEKRKKRKEEVKQSAGGEAGESKTKSKGTSDLAGDEFFGEGSSEEEGEAVVVPKKEKGKKKGKSDRSGGDEKDVHETRKPSTTEELTLLVGPDKPDAEPKHFDMKAVVKAEKKKGRKGKKGKKGEEAENEVQEDFVIDVQDERFKAIHEDPTFAIDPSNPQYVSFFNCPLLF